MPGPSNSTVTSWEVPKGSESVFVTKYNGMLYCRRNLLEMLFLCSENKEEGEMQVRLGKGLVTNLASKFVPLCLCPWKQGARG